MYDEDASILAGMFILLLLFLVLAVNIAVAYFLYDVLRRLPQRHRTVEPYFAWLTLIPFAGIVFMWMLLPFKIPESFARHFSENPPNTNVQKDFGKSMGLATMISTTLCLVPFINLIAWIPALVCFVLYLQQVFAMRKLLPAVYEPQEASVDRYSQLERLKELLDKGALTQTEYEAEKAKLL